MNKELANKIVLLNGYRKELGMVALDTWSKSETALDAEITKTQTQAIERAANAKNLKAAVEVKDMLTRLNNYLTAMGKAEVKEWNGTLDELSKRVATARRDHKDLMDEEKKMAKKKVTVAEVMPTVKKGIAKKVEKAVIKAKAKKVVAAAPVAEQGLLPRIATELGLNPKVARAKLRKAFGSDWRKLSEKEIRKALA